MKSVVKNPSVIALLTILSAAALPAEARSTSSNCTMEVLNRNPELIEAACTLVIRQEGTTDRERAEALYLRGFRRMTGRLYTAAIHDFDEGLELAPEYNLLHRQRGWIAMRRGNLKKAFFHARRAIELHPTGSEEQHVLALIHLSAGQLELALESFSNAIAFKDDHVWSRYQRARIRIRRGNYKDALKDTRWLINVTEQRLKQHGTVNLFEKRIGLYPAIRVKHASVLSGLGRFDEGEKVLNELVEHRANAFTFMARAQYLTSLPFGNLGLKYRGNDAVKDLQAAVEHDPDYAYAWRFLALKLQTDGRTEKARAENERALAANERAIATNRFQGIAPYLIWERAWILRSLERTDEAVEAGLFSMQMAFNAPARRAVVARFISSMRQRGYWQTAELPTHLSQDVIDATTACFHDPACR